MSGKQHRYTVLAVFVVVTLAGLAQFFWYSQYQREKNNHNTELSRQVSISCQVISDTYRQTTRIIFNEIINRPNFLLFFSRATNPDPQIRKLVRREIYEELLPLYRILAQENFRLFQLHLPDSTSFLRFHKPEKFGDKLSRIRYSLALANHQSTPISGFEEGRYGSCFRYIYPIRDGHQHLGSMEIGVSFSAFKQELQKLTQQEYSLILRRDRLVKIISPEIKKSYLESSLSPAYVCTKDDLESPLLRTLNLKLRQQPEVTTKLDAGEKWAQTIDYKGHSYFVAFLPVKNIKGEQVAYIVACSQDPLQTEILHRFMSRSLASLLFLSLIFLTFFLVTKKNKMLYRMLGQQE
jgi:hypothetical protein